MGGGSDVRVAGAAVGLLLELGLQVGEQQIFAAIHGGDGVVRLLPVEVGGRIRSAAHRAGSSVSIGIAISLGEDLDCDELFRRADDALYRAKRSGRDTSVLWEPPLPSGRGTRVSRH